MPLEVLGDRLSSAEGPFEALHLSCHGDIVPERGPVLLLETLAGDPHEVGPGDLARGLGERKPPLVVLSACRTAERGPPAAATGNAAARRKASLRHDQVTRGAGGMTGIAGPELASPFARRLVTMVANVVGWDGSVYDRDATDFAGTFYEASARGPRSRMRQPWRDRRCCGCMPRILRGGGIGTSHTSMPGRAGGGAIRASGKPVRPASTIAREFLDTERREVPVAPREAFVGRRQFHQALRGKADHLGSSR
jgi:hypothetical protein